MVINKQQIERSLAEKGMSKSALAEKCGVSRQSISTILGRGTCEPKTVSKLAAALGVTVAEIVQQ